MKEGKIEGAVAKKKTRRVCEREGERGSCRLPSA